MCGMVWSRIPRPESATSRVTCPSSRAAETTIVRARRRVHERVVEQDPHRPARRAPGRTRSRSGRARPATVQLRPRAPPPPGVNSPATSRASWPTSVGSGRSSSAPDSSRERSSSSVASLRIRSTWPRSCARNCARVSSSSSSSSSSSRKPPSEKIGVRSSCEAEAMNCLRAVSSRASWRCMSSNAAASWPSSSSESAWIGLEKSPAATLRAACSSRLIRAVQRARDEVAARARRARARCAPATRIRRRIRLTLACDVVERVGEDGDAAHLGACSRDQRHRRRAPGGRPPVCSVDVTGLPRLRRALGRRPRTSAQRDARPGLESRDRVDLERRAPCLTWSSVTSALELRRRVDRLALELRRRSRSAPTHRPASGRGLAPRLGAEPLELLRHQLVLEPRHDVEVDDPDRPGHDQGEDQRQAVAERPQRPRHRHSSSVSRKR